MNMQGWEYDLQRYLLTDNCGGLKCWKHAYEYYRAKTM